jgi:glycosyltransferase involved in cell wall biosynthesis
MPAQPAPAPDKPQSVTLLCSRYHPERYGGVEERLWQITQALAKNDCDVQVITENRLGSPDTEQLGARLAVRRILPMDEGPLWRIYYAAKAYQWRKATAMYASGDVIWSTEPSMAVGALSVRPRRRVVFNPAACAAGMRSIWRLRPETDSMKVPHHLILLDKLAYWYADAVVMSSANVRDQFERAYGSRPGKVHVVPYAALASTDATPRTDARARFGIEPEAFCIGFVGRLDPCKDVPFLIDAIAGIADRDHIQLLLVGVGPDESRIRRKAEERGIAKHLIWAGRMDSPGDAYAAMDVLVLPSVYEAFGLVLLEAMAAGVPVIGRANNGTSVLTATAEIVPPTAGLVIRSDSVPDMTRALRLLLEDPVVRTTMGQEARRHASRRTWNDVAVDYLHVLKE